LLLFTVYITWFTYNSKMEENNVKEVKEPTIVTFAYKDLRKVDGDKWVAKCKYCNTVHRF